MRHKIFTFCVIFCLFLAAGCEREASPPGVVASVNGENIYLHSVQALLDSRSAALGIPSSPSLSEMRQRYGSALSVLIVHALVRQDLARRGMAVSEAELDKAIDQIKSDYTEGSLEDFLAEAYLREDEWRQLMRDYLSLEVFTSRVLAPSIRIRLDEIKDYYNRHAKDFQLPETWRLCFNSAGNRAALEAWCAHLDADMLPESGVQCMTAVEKEIPDPWRRDIKKVKALSCARIVEEQGQWRVAAVLARHAAGMRKISDVYAVIENILLAEKKHAAFEQWLSQKLASADIKGAPDIFPAENER